MNRFDLALGHNRKPKPRKPKPKKPTKVELAPGSVRDFAGKRLRIQTPAGRVSVIDVANVDVALLHQGQDHVIKLTFHGDEYADDARAIHRDVAAAQGRRGRYAPNRLTRILNEYLKEPDVEEADEEQPKLRWARGGRTDRNRHPPQRRARRAQPRIYQDDPDPAGW